LKVPADDQGDLRRSIAAGVRVGLSTVSAPSEHRVLGEQVSPAR
jgi:hypothetical protein